MFVEREIRHELLELPVFLLQLAQTLEFGDAEAGEALLPTVERLLTDAQAATDLGHWGALLGLAQGVDDLLVGEGRLLHVLILLVENSNLCSGSGFRWQIM